jgi:hypothetical protein
MKTLEEYNRDSKALDDLKFKARAGVACDKCGEELVYPHPGMILTSYPPKMEVLCPSCGFKGYKY